MANGKRHQEVPHRPSPPPPLHPNLPLSLPSLRFGLTPSHLISEAFPQPKRRPQPQLPPAVAQLLHKGRCVLVSELQRARPGLAVPAPPAAGAGGGAAEPRGIVNESQAVEHAAHGHVRARRGNEEGYLRVGPRVDAVVVVGGGSDGGGGCRRPGIRGRREGDDRAETRRRSPYVQRVRLFSCKKNNTEEGK